MIIKLIFKTFVFIIYIFATFLTGIVYIVGFPMRLIGRLVVLSATVSILSDLHNNIAPNYPILILGGIIGALIFIVGNDGIAIIHMIRWWCQEKIYYCE